MFKAYLDESYNTRTVCVGGFLAHEKVWQEIEPKWKERIAYENRKSAKLGFPPISRYHATDCANLKNEFAPEKGWDIPRQIKLTKRWIEIIQLHRPAGIVMGGGAADFLKNFTSDTERWREGLYYFSIIMCLYHIADLMEGTSPNEKVSVFYDRGKFAGMADLAFHSLMDDPRNAHVAKYFFSMAPAGWEDCLPLQPADFMVYEGFRRIDTSIRGIDSIRKSLQEMVGKKTTLIIGHFSEKTFEKMIEGKKKELEELGFFREGPNSETWNLKSSL